MSIPPKTSGPPAPGGRAPWPEIDGLTPDAAVDLVLPASWYAGGKVVLDYAVAVLLLPLALVLIGLAAAAVKLTSPGPVFYIQTRVGLNGRRYRMVKIRTMHNGCELRSGIKWAKTDDDRITRVGKLLRRTHIDELPQLLNVLAGHMSLVGPRPERPEVIQAKGLDQLVPGYALRLRVKPGVTGLAQVQLPADTDLTSVRYKVVYDLYYARHQGLLFDLRLILATLAKAGGFRPAAIRRLFLLPSRHTVAAGFHDSLTADQDTLTHQLQPA